MIRAAWQWQRNPSDIGRQGAGQRGWYSRLWMSLLCGVERACEVIVLEKWYGKDEASLFELRLDIRIFHPFGCVGKAFVVQEGTS